MVEVFKTNVNDLREANMLIDCIHTTFIGFKANFDLDDCDNILRVECTTGPVEASLLIDLMKSLGLNCEILPDELPARRAIFYKPLSGQRTPGF